MVLFSACRVSFDNKFLEGIHFDKWVLCMSIEETITTIRCLGDGQEAIKSVEEPRPNALEGSYVKNVNNYFNLPQRDKKKLKNSKWKIWNA